MDTTATVETAPTVHVAVPVKQPTEDGRTLITRQDIGAIRTQTEGLVVFPRLLDLGEVDESVWHVTHVGTGRRIPADFPDQEHATRFANAAHGLADWTQQSPDLPRTVQLQIVVLAEKHGALPDPVRAEVLAGVGPGIEEH